MDDDAAEEIDDTQDAAPSQGIDRQPAQQKTTTQRNRDARRKAAETQQALRQQRKALGADIAQMGQLEAEIEAEQAERESKLLRKKVLESALGRCLSRISQWTTDVALEHLTALYQEWGRQHEVTSMDMLHSSWAHANIRLECRSPALQRMSVSRQQEPAVMLKDRSYVCEMTVRPLEPADVLTRRSTWLRSGRQGRRGLANNPSSRPPCR